MFDGSYEIFEKLKRKDTAMVIPIKKDGKIIITKQEQPSKKPFLGLVGVQIDSGEEVLEAAKRELLEETGYKSDKWKLWFAIQPYSRIEWAIYFLITQDCEKIDDQNLDAGEKIELQTLSFEEFAGMVLKGDFNDVEIRLKIFEAYNNPEKIGKLKNYFLNEFI